MKTKKWSKKTITFLLLSLIVLVLLGMSLFVYVYYFSLSSRIKETTEGHSYALHYALIVEDPSSQFWQSVYDSAQQAAVAQDAYLELMGQGSTTEYSLVDELKISIAADVDGILICPDGTAEVNALITEATDADIPVVTLLEDAPESGRISYVGINTYDFGLTYGEAIMRQAHGDDVQVMVIQDEEEESSNNELILTNIRSTVNQETEDSGQTVTINSQTINTQSAFDVEEAIRDIFTGGSEVPDILVCLSEVSSECASQAVVDYNRVGEVQIIGYYVSDIVVDALEKGIIAESVVFDTQEMGASSVQALTEYADTGFSSDYYSVDLQTVTPDTINAFDQ